MIKKIINVVASLFLTISCTAGNGKKTYTLDDANLSDIKGVWMIDVSETVKWVNDESKYTDKRKAALLKVYSNEKAAHNFMKLILDNEDMTLSFGESDNENHSASYTLIKDKTIEVEHEHTKINISMTKNGLLKVNNLDKIRNLESTEFWKKTLNNSTDEGK